MDSSDAAAVDSRFYARAALAERVGWAVFLGLLLAGYVLDSLFLFQLAPFFGPLFAAWWHFRYWRASRGDGPPSGLLVVCVLLAIAYFWSSLDNASRWGYLKRRCSAVHLSGTAPVGDVCEAVFAEAPSD